MKRFFLTVALAVCVSDVVSAQKPAASHDGGISPEMLEQISATYEDNLYDKAISNALAGTSIATLAINADNAAYVLPTIYIDGIPDGMFADIRNARAAGADVVVVSLNWGKVSASKPTAEKKEFRQMLAFHRSQCPQSQDDRQV